MFFTLLCAFSSALVELQCGVPSPDIIDASDYAIVLCNFVDLRSTRYGGAVFVSNREASIFINFSFFQNCSSYRADNVGGIGGCLFFSGFEASLLRTCAYDCFASMNSHSFATFVNNANCTVRVTSVSLSKCCNSVVTDTSYSTRFDNGIIDVDYLNSSNHVIRGYGGVIFSQSATFIVISNSISMNVSAGRSYYGLNAGLQAEIRNTLNIYMEENLQSSVVVNNYMRELKVIDSHFHGFKGILLFYSFDSSVMFLSGVTATDSHNIANGDVHINDFKTRKYKACFKGGGNMEYVNPNCIIPMTNYDFWPCTLSFTSIKTAGSPNILPFVIVPLIIS